MGSHIHPRGIQPSLEPMGPGPWDLISILVGFNPALSPWVRAHQTWPGSGSLFQTKRLALQNKGCQTHVTVCEGSAGGLVRRVRIYITTIDENTAENMLFFFGRVSRPPVFFYTSKSTLFSRKTSQHRRFFRGTTGSRAPGAPGAPRAAGALRPQPRAHGLRDPGPTGPDPRVQKARRKRMLLRGSPRRRSQAGCILKRHSGVARPCHHAPDPGIGARPRFMGPMPGPEPMEPRGHLRCIVPL
jgi:hypothetical protein